MKIGSKIENKIENIYSIVSYHRLSQWIVDDIMAYLVLKLILLTFSTDKMSEVAILDVVKKNFDDHLILGEEGGLIGNTSSDYLWCIDPLGMSLIRKILHVYSNLDPLHT